MPGGLQRTASSQILSIRSFIASFDVEFIKRPTLWYNPYVGLFRYYFYRYLWQLASGDKNNTTGARRPRSTQISLTAYRHWVHVHYCNSSFRHERVASIFNDASFHSVSGVESLIIPPPPQKRHLPGSNAKHRRFTCDRNISSSSTAI